MEKQSGATKMNFKPFASGLLIVSVISFVLHYLILRFVDIGIGLGKVAEIYGFVVVLSVAHFVCIKWLFGKWPKYAGLLFTGISMFKMLIAILYLLPDIYPSNDTSSSIVLNFMTVYLIMLFYEVIFIVKALMKSIKENLLPKD